MKINLTLTDDGPPFLFLGDPDKLVLSLTFQDPGPKEVDFSLLSFPDQRKVIAHMKGEELESDIPLQGLIDEYQKIFSQSAPAEPAPKGPAKKPAGADEGLKMPETYLKKEEKFQAKCKKLVKKTLKALKVELTKDNDSRTLQTVRDLELKKKSPRASVLNFIELELRKLQREIVESIENDANPGTIKTEPLRGQEKFVSDVVESEQEIVQLTPETLIGRMAK